jgi:SAM-dependent methyltransferase
MANSIRVVCPACGTGTLQPAAAAWRCDHCPATFAGNDSYVDLDTASQAHTADHYSLQWGGELGFLKFIQDQQGAKQVMPAARLGWDRLFAEIRDRAATAEVAVYDAACGFGGLANELITPETAPSLSYVGADVHGSLAGILDRVPAARQCALLMRWDIGRVLPVAGQFDYVLCRAALHHTPDPRQTFRALTTVLKPGGEVAISVYRRKGPCREASDDALRAAVGALTPEQAFTASAQFTVLGKALQAVSEPVTIPEDLPLLGISAGTYPVQALIYAHFLKCFYNPIFGDTYSTLVNYDWYHPQYASRHEIDDVHSWFAENAIDVIESTSIDVQHYVRGRRRS